MQLDKIKSYIQQYSEYLSSFDASKRRLHYWETQKTWQENWDKEAIDWAPMYDACLQNGTTNRLWKREGFESKKMMLTFIEMDKHFVFSMFNDLFNEDKEIHGRVDRFSFYCDQLLMQYRADKPMRIDTGHFHENDYKMISLYLSFQFPTLYAPYDSKKFLDLLRKIGAANIPSTGDFPRHVKVMRVLQSFLMKEESILSAHQDRLRDNHYQGDSLLLAFDFARFINYQ